MKISDVKAAVSQEHYAMACLERFGLANCTGVDKPMTSRLTAKDQPADVNISDQELYPRMVGSLLYLASSFTLRF